MRVLPVIATFCVVTLLAGCGTSFPVLVSLKVTPNPAVGTIGGAAVQFTATGTFSDFTTSTNIPGLTWGSGDMNTATITQSGAASCVGGNGTPISISASAQVQQAGIPPTTVTGAAQLTCNP